MQPVQNKIYDRANMPDILLWLCLFFFVTFSHHYLYAEYEITQIADDNKMNRDPVISSTGLIAWYAYEITETGNASSDIFIYDKGTAKNITKDIFKLGTANNKPVVSSDTIVWGITDFESPATNTTDSNTISATIGRNPSGNNEICMWNVGGEFKRLTSDSRNDLSPDISGQLVAWQKAKGWPFGWEIMVLEGDFR